MKPILELRNITFGYENQPLFQGFNLSLLPGRRLGLMGPNGVGKTTLLRLIVGLIKPCEGEVVYKGKSCRSEADFRLLRREVGLVFQDPDDQLFCPTVAEDIAFGPLNLGLPRKEVKRIVRQTLALLGLEGFEDRVIYRLSGGEKRLVALATVLAMSPKVLLLDEPTGDLDTQNTEKLLHILPRLSAAQLIVSHDLDFLQAVTDEIWWLEAGRLKPLPSRFWRATHLKIAQG